jgi:hypothetical protein
VVRILARNDWFYVNIRREQGDALDKILKKEGKKWGIHDKVTLVRVLVADLIAKYEVKHDLISARDAVRLDKDRDAMRPLSIL